MGRKGSSGIGADFGGTGNATKSGAGEDWFEYENANVMAEFIETGVMPTEDMYGNPISLDDRVKLAHEANLLQEEGEKTNTGYNTLYRGMVMSEDGARSLTPGDEYKFNTLSATTPDKKMAGVYTDVENYGGGEGVSVIFTIQKSDGIRGAKLNNAETVLPKGSTFRIVSNAMDANGVVHIGLYAKKGNNVKGS